MATINMDDFKLAIEAVSGGENTVIFDNQGMPSVMVPIPKYKYSELYSGGSENTHPAFSVNSVEKDVMYFSKFQNIVINERAYSLPLRDPKTSVNFDQAVTYSRNKGDGWSLNPHSLWAAVALWSKQNGTMPHGNNNHGRDVTYSYEKGTACTYDSNSKVNHTLTGSGPKTWYHDHSKNGIADMNGNVSEWQAGLRVVDGELQIIPYANSMDSNVSLSATSTAWRAIMPDGTLVAPGTTGTLKYDWADSKIKLGISVTNEDTEGHSCVYTSMALTSDVAAAPELVKGLILFPDDLTGNYGGDYHYVNTSGERMAIAGGNWYSGANAGVFYVNLYYLRSDADSAVGFRSAYCEL